MCLKKDPNQAALVPTSRHNKPESALPPIPTNVTHVYTRQHAASGLQVPYEGPFKVDSWPSKSTVKIEVGVFKSGEKRFEIRHVNDLKLAHPESLAAPAVRPRLGTPAAKTSSSDKGQTPTELPDPPKLTASSGSKQEKWSTGRASSTNDVKSGGTENRISHETSILIDREPASAEAAKSRPVRITRNPDPYYVDTYQFESYRPWSASESEIEALNKSIYG